MKKTFCDICGKEIKEHDCSYSITINRNINKENIFKNTKNDSTCTVSIPYYQKESFDEICPDCKQEIDIIIERLKKE